MKLVRIIIPTKNEENYLPKLLDSIKKQSFKNYEVVVADANSSDKTIKIAKKYKCKIVKGGPPSIARNNGANKSKSKILLFADSDVIFENKDFLKIAVDKFQKEKLVAAGFYLKYPKHSNLFKNFYLVFSSFMQNLTFRNRQDKKKPAMQCVMMFNSKAFFEVEGFRDVFAEEGEILERILKNYRGKIKAFRIIKEAGKIATSHRRFEKEGYFRYSIKSIGLLYHAYYLGNHKNSKEYFKN